MFNICHGCGGQIHFPPFFRVFLRKSVVFFHKDCLEFFKRNNAYRIQKVEEVK